MLLSPLNAVEVVAVEIVECIDRVETEDAPEADIVDVVEALRAVYSGLLNSSIDMPKSFSSPSTVLFSRPSGTLPDSLSTKLGRKFSE